MQDSTITAALVKLLEAKLQDKKSEMEALSQPILERTPEYNHRKFQVEVEHWQLHGLLTDIRALVETLGHKSDAPAE